MSNEGIPADPFGAEENYGIPRQQTRCRVIVHSHITENDMKGVVDCSEDVIACQTSKTIKGGGGAQLTLVPRRNYINYIFPNDWINIWFDPGDGRGYIRTFFGFVDRISRSITTDGGTGATTTQYAVVCSDFTKAFDKTNIYFNPHVADREDFLGEFAGTTNIAGAALRTKGVSVYGSPADIVLNLTHLLLGFNSQFKLPPKYPVQNSIIENSIKFREEWIRQRLPAEVKTAVGSSTFSKWHTQFKRQAAALAELLLEEDKQAWQTVVKTQFGTGPTRPGEVLPATEQEVLDRINFFRFQYSENLEDAQLYVRNLANRALFVLNGIDPDIENNTEFKNAVKLNETIDKGISLLDLLDLSFVEYGAIDGSLVSTSIWTQQGTLWSIINSYSNGDINELFCDLRPLGADFSKYPLSEGGYSRIPDEHRINSTTGEDPDDILAPSTNAVRFVPALIMREYPYSTIDSVDIEKVSIFGEAAGQAKIGAIFSRGVNQPGRKVKQMKPLSEYLVQVSQDPQGRNACYKHLDVAVISVQDIITEEIGRSDADTVNLIELYSDGFFGKHMKFLSLDAQPIINPISVMRHGLRVRTYNTRFARFSEKHKGFSGVDNFGTRRKLIRWVLMLDHWYQHNIEYLNGTISTRAFPEIRVGYRLDIEERRESYYVEGVNHSWQYPGPMTSSFTLSRGQRNDPFPIYEKPALMAFNHKYGEGRRNNSRLANFFEQADPAAVLRSTTGLFEKYMSEVDAEKDSNKADMPELNKKSWGNKPLTYVAAKGGDYPGVISIMSGAVDGVRNVGSALVAAVAQELAQYKSREEAVALVTRLGQDDFLGSLSPVKGSAGTGRSQ